MHNNPNKMVETSDGEIVCICGVIIEEKTSYAGFTHSQNAVSLYHQIENGGDPKDMKVVNKKIHIHYSCVSEFSNICGKLKMHSFVQQRAWRMYQQLRSKTHFSRAKCSIFAIYVACRESSQAITEIQIQESIRSALCVKNVPNVLSVISEMHEEAFKIGIDTNEGHSSKYYLNLEMAEKQNLFADTRDYDKFKIKAMNVFECLNGNNQNKAKRAASIALDEMGAGY